MTAMDHSGHPAGWLAKMQDESTASPAPALPESGVDVLASAMANGNASILLDVQRECIALRQVVNGFLACPEIAECAAEDKAPETEALERRARALAAPAPAPAPAPVDGEPAARPYWRDYPAGQKISPALAFEGGCLTINGQGYGDNDGAGTFAFKDDDLLWGHGEDEGYRYIHLAKSELEAIRHAIAASHGPYAKPAPAPVDAGGLVAAREAVERLANTPMNLSLIEWNELSNTILSALAAAAEREAALVEKVRQSALDYLALDMQATEALKREAALVRERDEAIVGAEIVQWRELKSKLAAAEARVTAAENAVADEVDRLRPHYQSNTTTDIARRQMLDHFAARFPRAAIRKETTE